MKSLNQLLLDFNYEQNFKDDDFYVGKSNYYTFEIINKWPKWEKNILNISGEKFSGKTHLVNIFLKKFNGIKIESNLLNNEDLKTIKSFQCIVLEDLTLEIDRLVKKYDIKDHIILIVYKTKNEVKILSKINLDNSTKLVNKTYSEINLQNEINIEKLIIDLKDDYENQWKKNNEINTSIKLPITISLDSKDYKRISKIKNVLANMDLISEFYTLKFDNQNFQIRIIYNGSPKLFLSDMRKQNFDLVMTDNVWVVK